MHRVLAPFQRLRWKLTLSYTLVTVAALFVVELAVVGWTFLMLRSMSDPAQLSTVVASLSQSLARSASTYLEPSPPDLAGLRSFLQSLSAGFGVSLVAADESADPASLAGRNGIVVLVFDADGRLLDSAPRVPDLLGRPMDPSLIPGLAPALSAALTGKSASAPLDQGSIEHLIQARPIRSEDGRLLGAIVVTARPDVGAGLIERVIPAAFAILGLSLVAFLVAAGIIGTVFGFVTARGLSRRIDRLARAATTWSRGDFSTWVEDRGSDELGQLARTLNGMAQQLQNLLAVRQEVAGLRERERLARELHDSVKQQVFATAMQLGAARALLESDSASAARHLSEAELLTRQAQRELQSLIQALRPADLGPGGLVAALEDLASAWSRQTGITLQARIGPVEAAPSVEQALYRIAQEALANVARHSGARAATLVLRQEGEQIHLSVEDDGAGFDPATARTGVGLASMRERVEALGGRLEIASQPGRGTSVTAACPRVGAQSEVTAWPIG